MVVEGTLDGGIGFVKGDVFSIRRIIYDIPAGVTISSAELEPSSGTTVTATVEDSGADGTGSIRFDISASFWSGVTAGTVYDYDIAVTFSNGDVITLESGTFVAKAAVT